MKKLYMKIKELKNVASIQCDEIEEKIEKLNQKLYKTCDLQDNFLITLKQLILTKQKAIKV